MRELDARDGALLGDEAHDRRERLRVPDPRLGTPVPGRGDDKQDCLSARAQRQWPDALVVHRLDMATSGLVLMARDGATQRALGDAFANRDVDKRYEAVVDGLPGATGSDARGWSVIDAPIAPGVGLGADADLLAA